MSIDGIGRPPRPPGAVGPSEGPAAPAPTQGNFHIESGAAATGTAATGPLAQLERGEITVEQYLTTRVDEAVAPFASRLDANALEFMRNSLRAELENDPVLVELVRRATGVIPGSSER